MLRSDHDQRLVERLTAGVADDPLAADLGAWLAGSSRFRRFATVHADKIHKKLRGATDPEARRDVRAELGVARLLLADRRIELAYEAYGAGRGGPDFTASFREGRPFDVEVTRLHRRPEEADGSRPILAKLRQLRPSVPNLVVVAVGGPTAEALDVGGVVRGLRAVADRKDEAFFIDRGFAGTVAFYERLLRLGAVITWCESAVGDGRASLWVNASARIALPARASAACLGCLRADGS